MPHEVWEEAERRYDEQALAALLIALAAINTWNSFKITICQVAGSRPT